MNKHLQVLVELSKIDKQIDSFNPKIALVRKELDSKIAEKNATLQNIQNLQKQIDTLQLQVDESERVIGENSKRLEEIAKKNQEVRTEKELRALNIEEDIAKENLNVANEEIVTLQNRQKEKLAEAQKLQATIEEIEKGIQEAEKSVQAEMQLINKEQEKLFEQRRNVVGKADSKTISFYEKIRRWAKNTSVVPVFKQACGGCFIRLSDKTYSEVLSSNDIVTCPHCGRILFPSDRQTYKECLETSL